MQYPAQGSPALADETKSLVTTAHIESDHQWGLDHGAWSVIRHLYPKADVAVIQMSLDYLQSPRYHYDLMKELTPLRKKGILCHGKAFELAVPTPEHYLPLLSVMALKEEQDEVLLFNDKAVAGSLTMTSVKIG